jgi:hypothetical protein
LFNLFSAVLRPPRLAEEEKNRLHTALLKKEKSAPDRGFEQYKKILDIPPHEFRCDE